MFGLLTELGNLLFSDESLKTEEYRTTGIPTPIYNPNSWTRIGHLLSFDQPAPIGFSYCGTNPNNVTYPHSCNGIVWDDALTAQAAYQALLAFYRKFPLYYNVDLYLTGESYAGIYIPTLAREIVRYNVNRTNTDGVLPLRGFAVGDGCLGTETDICGNLNPQSSFDIWNVIFLAGHGQIPMSTFQLVMDVCDHQHGHISDDFVSTFVRMHTRFERTPGKDSMDHLSSTMSCEDAITLMNNQAGGVYAYGYVRN
jgi:serine carboxypeptidase-like clade I